MFSVLSGLGKKYNFPKKIFPRKVSNRSSKLNSFQDLNSSEKGLKLIKSYFNSGYHIPLTNVFTTCCFIFEVITFVSASLHNYLKMPKQFRKIQAFPEMPDFSANPRDTYTTVWYILKYSKSR